MDPYGSMGGGRRRPAVGALPDEHRGWLAATTYDTREAALVEAYEAAGRRHNSLGLTRPEDPVVHPFHDRPFLFIGGDRFADACLEAVTDRHLTALPLVGAVDQWVDSTDVLGHARRVRALTAWYEAVA